MYSNQNFHGIVGACIVWRYRIFMFEINKQDLDLNQDFIHPQTISTVISRDNQMLDNLVPTNYVGSLIYNPR